jgi:hypothetical protein
MSKATVRQKHLASTRLRENNPVFRERRNAAAMVNVAKAQKVSDRAKGGRTRRLQWLPGDLRKLYVKARELYGCVEAKRIIMEQVEREKAQVRKLMGAGNGIAA